jgi:4-hydroxybenzoate polyprenyltransferase
MRLVRSAAWLIFSNRLHVVAMPAVLTWFWEIVFRLGLPPAYYVMVCAHTAAAYWYNILTDAKEDAVNYPAEGRLVHPGARWLKPAILLLWVVSFTIALRAGWRLIAWGTLLNLLGGLYGREWTIRSRRVRIKAIPGLKNVWSCVFWSAALLITPFVYTGRPLDLRLAGAIPLMFLLTFFVELLWDFRDVEGDAAAGVRTLPIVAGPEKSRWLLHVANGIAVSITLLAILGGWFPLSYGVLVVHAIVVAAFTEWYVRSPDRQLASHVYLLFAGAILLSAITLDRTSLLHQAR